jgi:ADP-heptose:LPS heptosyltransferase
VNALSGWIRQLSGEAGRRIKTIVFRALGALFRGRVRVPGAPPSRVLVLQLQQLGDSVIFTPTLRALREHWPEARIDLLTSAVAAHIYKKSPWRDGVHVAKSWTAGRGGNRLRPMLRLLGELRAERYDCTVTDLTQQSFKYSLIARLVGAPLRVGFDVGGRGFLHNVRVPFRPEANWVDANLDIVRTLGGTPRSAQEEVAFDASDTERVRALLGEAGHADGRRLVAVHTGSNWQSRTWYVERWAAACDALGRRHGVTIAFVGSPGEREYVEQVRAAMTTPSISLAGATDIPQLAALFAIADLFIGTDSGPRHIARASGCPHVVVMCAQDDTDRWLGWGRGEVLMRSLPACSGCYYAHCAHKLCMDAIETDRVLARCEEILADPGARTAAARRDRVAIPERLAPLAARGKTALRALAKAP